MNKFQKGFTLIELLVVIAIIGILAALVLVALGNARTKANDARIKSNIGQLRTLAEVFYDAHCASYGGVCSGATKDFGTCFTTPSVANCAGGIETSIQQLKDDTVSAYSGSTLTVTADPSNFCIEAILNASTTVPRICVDETGAFDSGNTAAACTGAAAGC